jgi:hypothetical protein
MRGIRKIDMAGAAADAKAECLMSDFKGFPHITHRGPKKTFRIRLCLRADIQFAHM